MAERGLSTLILGLVCATLAFASLGMAVALVEVEAPSADGFDFMASPPPVPSGQLDQPGEKYLVLTDPLCDSIHVATSGGCWALSSGGPGGAGSPTLTELAIADINSGVGTAEQGASLAVYGLLLRSFRGTWVVGPWSLAASGVGIFVGDSVLHSDGASISTVYLNVTGGEWSGGSSSIVDQGPAIVRGSGHINMSSGFVFVRDTVYVVGSAAYLSLGASIWNTTGDFFSDSTSALWDAGTSEVRFSGQSPQTIGGAAPLISLHDVRVLGAEKRVTTNIMTANFTTYSGFAVTVRFVNPNIRWTVLAGSSISGTGTSSMLTLQGFDARTSWQMEALGAKFSVAAHYVDVQRCDARPGGTILANDGTNINSGWNKNWKFH